MIALNPKIDALRAKANSLVEQPGVYLMKDKKGKVIYVGKAKRLKHRVVSYFRKNKGHAEKVQQMVSHVDDFDYIVVDSEFEALVLECSLIKQYTPKYNILLKDDKGYHYIRLTREPYPRIQAAIQKTKDGSTYFGPYLSQYAVRQAVDEVNKVFGLPTCSRKFPEDFKKQRPCLNYHIKNCLGHCRGRIGEKAYNELVKEAVSYLKQGSESSIESMKKQMEYAAENLDFEKAARIRDKIKAINRLVDTQKVMLSTKKEQDFIGLRQSSAASCIVVLKFRNGALHDKQDFMFYEQYEPEELVLNFLTQYYLKGRDIPKVISLDLNLGDAALYEQYITDAAGHKVSITVPQRGEQRRIIEMAQNNALEQLSQRLGKKSKEVVALQQLKELLGLPKDPEYIESYDISNIGNDYMVGGMIVFQNARPHKAAYKRFSMKENLSQDDYACMSEVLRRRFRNYLDPEVTDEGFKKLPDLILLDGGKGHVSVVGEVLRELGIEVPLYGMVKDSRHRTRAIAENKGEIQLSGFQSAFKLVTQIQDEVHRFAISYQRKTHKKNTFTLGLTSVPGIGQKKAFALLKTFKTQKAMRDADMEQLRLAAKVSEETAQALYEYLHSSD